MTVLSFILSRILVLRSIDAEVILFSRDGHASFDINRRIFFGPSSIQVSLAVNLINFADYLVLTRSRLVSLQSPLSGIFE